ncbi:hypothetical protein HDU96_004161, partial [Phlyctochytrium bullatum]
MTATTSSATATAEPPSSTAVTVPSNDPIAHGTLPTATSHKGIKTTIQNELRFFWTNLTLQEVSGSLGDMGTLLPILVGLSKGGQISLTASLIFGGLFNIAAGFLFRVP